MSRATHHDNTNPVQLFPFVAVLLCTMGSLLVLLVGVARSSKVRGTEMAIAQQAAARSAAQAAIVARVQESPEVEEAARRELEKIAAYQTELDSVRTKAEAQIHQDQLRLSHLEDHMRRLREQLDSLQLAAAELNSLEGEHYDDREQAQREIERLQELIAEARKTIDELRAEAKSRAKSYAIVPYQGHRGTFRRPIYIECREDAAVLQPEGVRFTAQDFQPPIGPGNPLVAAIRAAHEHIVRTESSAATGKEAEPYPLIIVRPKGIKFYYCAREAIQSWDSEFGYELVEEDWELKFAPADPQLAILEADAAELARGRLRALAAAAPRAYGAYRSAGEVEGDEPLEDEEYSSAAEDDAGQPAAGSPARVTVVQVDPATIDPARRNAQALDDRYAAKTADDEASKSKRPPPSQRPIERVSSDDQPEQIAISAGDDPEQELDDRAREAAADGTDAAGRHKGPKVRGKNWAIHDAGPGMIPIRRTIQIVVREDAVAILPEPAADNQTAQAGREIPFADAPEAAYDDMLSAVDARIKDWGMAGQGLYWRPVVEVKVGPDGKRRADRLVRLLKYSGVEVRNAAVAQHDQPEDGRANR